MSDPHQRWFLRRVGSYQHVKTILHLDHDLVTINRSHNATHTFQTRFISRKHVILKNVNGEWFIKDSGGVNGTYLNSDRLDPNKEYPLVENDIIGIGMPLSQQNEEDSVVYRLCKDPVIRPSVSSCKNVDDESQGSEKACVKVEPNNHLVKNNPVGTSSVKKEVTQDLDQTIVKSECEQPREEPESSKQVEIKKEIDSQSGNPPEYRRTTFQTSNCDSTMRQRESIKPSPVNVKCENDEEIICIDIDDSDDEAPPEVKSPPVQQAPQPQSSNSECALPLEKSSAVAHIIASVTDDFINLCEEDDDDDGQNADSNSSKTNDMTVHKDKIQESNPNNAWKVLGASATSDPTIRMDEVEQAGGRASPVLVSENVASHSKIKEKGPSDKDVEPIVHPTTGMAPDEDAKSPSEQQHADSESEMCDDIGYSQDDELIIISDDESYVNEKNVKADSASFVVKEELIENVDFGDLEANDDWDNMFHDKLMEDIASDCEAEVQTSKSSEIVRNSNLSGPTNKVSKQAANSEALAIPGPSGMVRTSDGKMTEDTADTSDFFPILSQNFFAGEKSSDSEEEELAEGRSSAEENNVESLIAEKNRRISRISKNIVSPPKTPSPANRFHDQSSKKINSFYRSNRRPGETPRSTQLTAPQPFRKRFTAASNAVLLRPTPKNLIPPQNASSKRKRKGKNTSATKKKVADMFVNHRIPVPGGGTDTPMGSKSPTKVKPGHHVKTTEDKEMPNKLLNKNDKSNSSGLNKHVKQNAMLGAQEERANNVAKDRSIPNESPASPQELIPGRRPPVVRRDQKSRNDSFIEALMGPPKIPEKRKNSTVGSKPPLKKKTTDSTAPGSRKEVKDPQKKTIMLPQAPPISQHRPPANSAQQKPPMKASGTSNLSELATKNKKCNKRVTFSETPEIRYYQPDSHAVEEQIQCQDENTFGAPPQRLEVITAMQRILRHILAWKSAWLHEQEKVNHPPPIVNPKDIKDAVTTYSSHAEYVKIYEPLLLLETWESISQDWYHKRDSCPVIQLEFSKMQLDPEASKPESIYFHCHAVITEGDEEKGRLPQEGWLGILDVPVNRENPGAKVDGVGRSYVRLFAYVESCHKTTVNYLQKDGPISPMLRQLTSKHKDKKIVLRLVLQTTCTILSVSGERPLNFEMISYLKPQLRIFKAMHYLPFSLLGPCLLKPNDELCTIWNAPSSNVLLNVGNISYNATQRDIILKTTETVSSQDVTPKVCLVQGPPGTGKSSLVIGLILQLLFGAQVNAKNKPRILLCTPSNGAIDELLHRLLVLRKAFTSSRKLRMIRLGLPDSIQPHVKAYSLDNIVLSNITTQKTTLEKEINELTTALNFQHQRLDTAKLRNGKPSEISRLKVDIERKESNLNVIRKRLEECNNQSPEVRQRVYCNWREDCLKNADVIATTLGSCTQHGMEMFLRNNSHPFICIIDEATQCIEQETLLPLQFGVSKLILIGDPKQLPATVLSVKAKEKRLCQSLFERFYDYFGNSPLNPIVMLDTQYRMHPELCFYPSKVFYRNKLQTDSQVARKCAAVPTVPYLFFDIRDSQEESTGFGDISNPKEALFIVKLCEALLNKLNKFQALSLGIITFYQCQRRLLKEKLAASTTLQELNKVAHIEVNTVDGFQGREKDIIIVSTVRANSPNGSIGFVNHQRRLNVAITRAKYSLFICGHRESLKVSEHWRGLIDDASFRRKVEKLASPIPVTALEDLVTK